MVVVSFGSPSGISYAVVEVVRHLLAESVDAHAVLQVLHLEDFETQRQGDTGSGTVLVVSDCPHADLVARFADAGQPVLVCCDTVEVVVRYNMRSRGMAFAPALRFATQVLSALDALSGLAHVMRLTHRRDGEPLRAVVGSIATFLGLELTADRFEAAMRRIVEPGDAEPASFRAHVERRFPHAREAGDPVLPEREGALLEEVGRCYAPLVDGAPIATADWPAGLLLDWDHPGRFLDGPVALLGPARFVICGPYLHLPAGRWSMTVGFETRECRSDNRIEAEVFDGAVLAAVALPLPRQGRYAVAMEFAVADPLRPLELRVRLATGAIEGSFELLRLGLVRVAEPHARLQKVA